MTATQGDLSLAEHLAELRSCLLRALLAVVAGAAIGFVLYEPILELLRSPYCAVADDCRFLITNPMTGFVVRMRVSAHAGLLLASPVVFWQLWRFVSPGLHRHERRLAVPFVAASVLLFALGAGLALWTFPNALTFLLEVGGDGLDARLDPERYLGLVSFMMLAFGIGFEFPVLLVFLQVAGIVTPGTLARGRRQAIVGTFVLVAIITPSGDPFTLLTLAVPMVLFFEAALIVGRLVARRPSPGAALGAAGDRAAVPREQPQCCVENYAVFLSTSPRRRSAFRGRP